MRKNFQSIDEWVDYIQTLHFRNIDMSLDRVRQVYDRLFSQGVSFKVVTVAGSNGKGSTAELLSSIYFASGYQVAKYTSPHLQRFNERFLINRQQVDDDVLLDAFQMVEKARQETTLTFFEFGTLVAILIFEQAQVDVAVMEVGLGGRLDAVNALNADIAVVTSISIDHTNWLGSTIEEIAAEKIAIARPNRPCVVGLTKMPQSMQTFCSENDVQITQLGVDFKINEQHHNGWGWQSKQNEWNDLPLPFGQQGVQLENAAVSIMVCELMQSSLPIKDGAIHEGITTARLVARCQLVSESPAVVVDVAHNEASVTTLAEFLRDLEIKGRVIAVCGMLSDKQIGNSFSRIADLIDEWHFASIDHERGSQSKELQTILTQQVVAQSDQIKNLQIFCHDDVVSAYNTAKELLTDHDCLVIFGSFFIVGDILDYL